MTQNQHTDNYIFIPEPPCTPPGRSALIGLKASERATCRAGRGIPLVTQSANPPAFVQVVTVGRSTPRTPTHPGDIQKQR